MGEIADEENSHAPFCLQGKLAKNQDPAFDAQFLTKILADLEARGSESESRGSGLETARIMVYITVGDLLPQLTSS